MKTKIDELIQKVYKEGIEKAEEEQGKIISDAKKRAEEIINSATIRGNEIVLHAKKYGDDLRESTRAEVRLSIRQAINAVKARIEKLIGIKVIEEPIKEIFKDDSFLKNIIEVIIKNWNVQAPEPVYLGLVLPEKDRDSLNSYFNTKAIDIINSGLEVTFDGNVDGGFKVYPKGGNYHVSFTGDDFERFFRYYLRPQLINLLFGTDI